MTERRPRILMMGDEIPWDAVPTAGHAVELADHFKRVRLSPRAVDEASKIVPPELWKGKNIGIYTWLQCRAQHVFDKLSVDQREGRYGRLKYIFEFDGNGPVLKTIFLG